MKIVFASDSFKGSLSSEQVNQIEIDVANEVLGEGEYISLEMADGGEGTLAAIERCVPGYNRITRSVTGPLGKLIQASYLLRGSEAVIEMAEASGLTLVDEAKRDPMNTTSAGTGELICDAILNGARTIYIGIGGSATNDGGIGAMKAMGFRFLRTDNTAVFGYGSDLADIYSIDDSFVPSIVNECEFIVMCDVKNPLTGPNGATYTFGPQKGATGDILTALENGMVNYLRRLEKFTGKELSQIEGLGAAGGMGAALYALLGGTLKSGVDVLLDLAGFDGMIDGADAVISGEGRTDSQTLNGKVVYGIAKRCRDRGVPLHVISGSLGEGIEELYDVGVTSMTPCVTEQLTMEEIRRDSELNLRKASTMVLKLISEQ